MINQLLRGQGFWSRFIQTIQQKLKYFGSSATHFGSNAIGGAINIIFDW